MTRALKLVPPPEPEHVIIRVDARKSRWRVRIVGLGVRYQVTLESTGNRGRELEFDVILDQVRGLPCVLEIMCPENDDMPRFVLRRVLGFARTGIVERKDLDVDGFGIRGVDSSDDVSYGIVE